MPLYPVHLYGKPAEMDSINKIAQKNDVAVIEDAAQTLGAEYKGKKIGVFRHNLFQFFPV